MYIHFEFVNGPQISVAAYLHHLHLVEVVVQDEVHLCHRLMIVIVRDTHYIA